MDPAGPVTGSGEGNEGSLRVFRGGDWLNVALYGAVSNRYSCDPGSANVGIGFRLSRSSP